MFTQILVCTVLFTALLHDTVNSIRQEIVDAISEALKVRVFTPKGTVNFRAKMIPTYNGIKVLASESALLAPISNWLYNHDEYNVHAYIKNRLSQDLNLFTSDISKAQLCFPSCSGDIRESNMTRSKAQFLEFEVIPQYQVS